MPRIPSLIVIASSFVGFLAGEPSAQSAPPPQDPAKPTFAQLAWTTFVVFDMNGDGIVLTSKADGVSFDMAGTGSPEQIGWTRKGSDDAFLVRDNNGNGRVDSGTEMVGKRFKLGDQVITNGANTLSMNFQGIVVGPDGKSADPRLQPGPVDPALGRLDDADPEFANLRLWTDTNHDGQSTPDELRTMTEAGVNRIGTGFTMQSRDPAAIDENGNRLLFTGYFFVQGRGLPFQRTLKEFEPTRTSDTHPVPPEIRPRRARVRQLREDGTSEVLILNLDGSGLCLSSAADGVLSSPASEVERSGWTCKGTHNAFVVRDFTQDGFVNGEILGGPMGPPNGFMYLAAFDKPARGVIDSGTPAYSGLSLWTDLDHDGQSQDSELQSLAHAGIESISLAAKTVSEEVNGNIITRRSVAIRRGSKGLEEREIVTVKLNISK